MKASAGSSGASDGWSASKRSMIGVESWIPSPSGVTTRGTSGSLAYFWNSAWTAGERRIQSCGRPLKRKYERTFTEYGESSEPKIR